MARHARLRNPIGWLSLAGLHWLSPGETRIGADPGSGIVLEPGPQLAGRLVRDGDAVTAIGGGAHGFRHDGVPVDRLPLVPDVDAGDDGPTMLELGRYRMCAIRRGERFALRVWDTEAEALSAFSGIPHFPVDPSWRIEAHFEPAEPGRTVDVPDVLGGVEAEITPGRVMFQRGGSTHRLDTVEGGPHGELWLIFADATSGRETYGGGRYLYTDAPAGDGTVTVDFNRAYNPPCVFTPFATCPLPWPANRLATAVTAGELVPPGETEH